MKRDKSDNVIKFPNLVQLYLRRAAEAMQKDDFQEALDYLEEALDLDPAHHDAKQLRDSLIEMRNLQHEAASRGKDVETETVELWKQGLLQPNPKKQWQSFEQMHSFMEVNVFAVVQEFLLYEEGDPILKTKLIQQCKLTCPGSWSVDINKAQHFGTVQLAQVPNEADEWRAEWIYPLQVLQQKAQQDPSLVELAQEVWVFFLEKWYPFIPEIGDANKWTAALHYYTLKTIHAEMASQMSANIAELYHITEDEMIHTEQLFQEMLVTF